MPPGQWKKWETIWLLFREEIINVRISYHDRREDNSYFIPTSVGQLVTTKQLKQLYSCMKSLSKKTISRTQAEKLKTETGHLGDTG